MTSSLRSLAALSLSGLLFAACSASGNDAPKGGGGGASGSGGAGGLGGGGSGGISLDSGGSGGSFDPDASCQAISSEGKRTAASLLFLLDYSWSMCLAPNSGTSIKCATDPAASRWGILETALEAAIPALPTDAYTGVAYYPDQLTQGSCSAPTTPMVPLALNDGAHQTAIVGALPGVLNDSSPVLQTPTTLALGNMYAYYAGAGASAIPADAAKFVVLVTDGAPNCGGDATSVTAAVQAAFGQGVKTFVIGIPGAAKYNAGMSQAASKGGTGLPGCQEAGPNYCHFDLTQFTDPTALATELATALGAIQGAAVSCDYQIPDQDAGAFDANSVNVRYTHGDTSVEDLLYDAACAGDGWRYDDEANPKRIVICSSTCAALTKDSQPKVDILFGCPTNVK